MSADLDRRSLGRRWLDFWFASADPSMLGFMRIVTGVLVLYVHLAYCFDLQAFFGSNGWYRLEDINAERTQYPWKVQSFWNWEDEDFLYPAFLPEYAHRKKPVMEWYRKLAELPKAERDGAIAYIDLLQETQSPMTVAECLQFAGQIPQNPLAQKNRLDMIVDAGLRTPADNLPNFIQFMKDDDRKALRTKLAAFLAVLPAGPDHRRYVIDHLSEIGLQQRKMILRFLHGLPDDPVERDRRLDFVEKWNNEERGTIWQGVPIFSIWFHITDPTEMAVAHVIVLGIMTMFTLGLFTRVTSVLTWLAAVSYIHRTQQVLFGMDTMMNLLLIYLMIGPSGAALSLDRWRATRKAKRLSEARNNGRLDAATQRYLIAPPKSVAAGFVLRLIQVHFCFIYMAAGLSKLKGGTWWNHNAYWDTLANPEFTLMNYQIYENLVRSFVQIRPLYAFAAAGAIIFTFFMELGLPFLIWTRLRPYMIIGGVLFHFGIGLFMGLNLFALLMMTLLISYIPGEAVRDVLFGKDQSDKSSSDSN